MSLESALFIFRFLSIVGIALALVGGIGSWYIGYRIENIQRNEIEHLKNKQTIYEHGEIISYDFNGIKRIRAPYGFKSEVGQETEVYNKIIKLEKEKRFEELKKICEEQIDKTSDLWLTPHFYLGRAYENLGDKEKAINKFRYFLEKAPDDHQYSQAKEYIKLLVEE